MTKIVAAIAREEYEARSQDIDNARKLIKLAWIPEAENPVSRNLACLALYRARLLELNYQQERLDEELKRKSQPKKGKKGTP